MRLGDGECLFGVVVEQRLVPLYVQVIGEGDELRGRLAEVNDGRLSV